ncbi:MAG TPA: hypothetical protein VNY31_05750 [Solirubrobacteraceae bacterium]|jgi:hypothetical protein|nr:hypothetical protein [Solirubrobacteraceae bacterium]
MKTPVEERLSPDPGSGEHHHTAFGLALRIDPRISIPELGSRPDSVSAELPSHVRVDPDELRRRWDALATRPERVREIHYGETLLRSVDVAEPAGYLLWARDFGRVLISPDGIELLCEPDPANEDWASIISAQALPLAATLRGLEVLHASGVVLDGRAVLVTGPPGAGKSSLAAALVRAGGQLLSDDAVALALSDATLTAHSGSVALQLRAAEHERLSAEERAALGRLAGSIDGKHRYVSTGVPDAAPLGGLFLLERSAAEPAVERLGAVDPFELIASTFNLSVRTPERLRRQLDVVSAIASGGLAHRLRVQPGVDAGRLAAIVREHMEWGAVLGGPAPSGVLSRHERLLEL